LNRLEEIDDEADEHGIHLITTEETDLAQRFGIKTFPTLAFFRNQAPLIYQGQALALCRKRGNDYLVAFTAVRWPYPRPPSTPGLNHHSMPNSNATGFISDLDFPIDSNFSLFTDRY